MLLATLLFQRSTNALSLPLTRRSFVHSLVSVPIVTITTNNANAAGDDTTFTYSPKDGSFKLSLSLPSSDQFSLKQKPLKTHAEELTFCPSDSSERCSAKTFGVTVDPVKIKSLSEFGSPEEIVERIADAERGRDGIFEVKVAGFAPVKGGGVDVDYISKGKRGEKFVSTRTYVLNQKLFVFTSSVKGEAGFDDMKNIRDSFVIE